MLITDERAAQIRAELRRDHPKLEVAYSPEVLIVSNVDAYPRGVVSSSLAELLREAEDQVVLVPSRVNSSAFTIDGRVVAEVIARGAGS